MVYRDSQAPEDSLVLLDVQGLVDARVLLVPPAPGENKDLRVGQDLAEGTDSRVTRVAGGPPGLQDRLADPVLLGIGVTEVRYSYSKKHHQS